MQTDTTHPDPWRPLLELDVRLEQAGKSWDAVRVPASLGERILTLLGDESGPVIEDGRRMYWLVPVGAGPCPVLRDVALLPASNAETVYVGVPPVGRMAGPGLRWRVPAERGLTSADLLFLALRTALSTMPTPEAEVAPEVVR